MAEFDFGSIVCRNNRFDSRKLRGALCIDAQNSCMRVGTPKHLPVKHSRKMDIIQELRFPGRKVD
jgi:hypothetical protein